MLLNIVHETRYEYAPPVKTAQHMAHLRPLETAHQQLLAHELVIAPAPAQSSDTRDAFGNTRTFFSLPVHHDRLRVVASSTVLTSSAPVVDGAVRWDEASERLRYHREAAFDPASEFAFASPFVPRHPEFLDYAQDSFAPGRPLVEAARELMARIHRDFDYRPEATDVGTPALDVLRQRQGVCQDFAHVMLACLRSLGLPARYVSGYLLTEPPPGQARLVGGDASHAWVSVHVPQERGPGRWLDLDPTNGRTPGQDYVVLAIGRDYGDVSPLRGVIQGGADHRLHVAVTVTPASTIAA
ncbi:transglutaminase family protein [Ramlibacter solisilvae]|uniref:Transglutaminase n=1 Tax=Ramlibacter tataouinensis TaxID=94132 RepID=A0A127JPE0_9BURK|nr:transglutaminase family protein [Ramlibacter tataouinensis]AMO21886.1 transglutaminase [Ramlibacter tataouinensis]